MLGLSGVNLTKPAVSFDEKPVAMVTVYLFQLSFFKRGNNTIAENSFSCNPQP